MTLIIHAPYKGGIVLISDLQNSYFDNSNKIDYKEPVKKLFYLFNKDILIGCSGDTLAYQNLYYKLKRDHSLNADNVLQKIKDFIKEIHEESRLSQNISPTDLEICLITKDNDSIKSINLIGYTEKDTIDSDTFSFIGSIKFISPQIRGIKIIKEYFTQEDAIKFGVSLLKYIADLDDSVGGIEKYGCNIVVVDKKEGFT